MDPDAVSLVELNNSRSAAVNQAAQLVVQKVRFSFSLETTASLSCSAPICHSSFQLRAAVARVRYVQVSWPGGLCSVGLLCRSPRI
jgi:predicted CxxxxCH...CXXCH cytochrome family protein